jgi:malonyl-CoA O-methyltransferase
MNWPWIKKQQIVLHPLQGYERWASTYGSESNPVKTFSDQLLEKMATPLGGKNVLDAGSGTGYFCQLAEKQGAAQVTGIDLSPSMIAEAKKKSKTSEFLCGDIAQVKLEKNSFDLIVCGLVLGHIKDLHSVLNNLIPAIKNNGDLLITDFHPFLTLHHSKRTFLDPRTNETIEITHHLHLFQDYVAAFREHQMVIELLEEPLWKEVPVVFGMKVRKLIG